MAIQKDTFAGCFYTLYKENKEAFNFINELYEYHYIAFKEKSIKNKLQAKIRLREFLSAVSRKVLHTTLKNNFDVLKFWQQFRFRLAEDKATPFKDGLRFYSCGELNGASHWFNADYFKNRNSLNVELPSLPAFLSKDPVVEKPELVGNKQPSLQMAAMRAYSNPAIRLDVPEEISSTFRPVLMKKFEETLARVESEKTPEDYAMWLMNLMEKV